MVSMTNMKAILMSGDPVAELRALGVDGLRSMEPAVANLKMEIPKGYHHKDNLEHSLRVLGNAVSMEDKPDLVLRTAALLHDIGKPATREFGKNGKVTFHMHEMVGAKMSTSILRKHDYDSEDSMIIRKLISLHMRSHGFDTAKWNDSAVRRLMTDAMNWETLERLAIVFKSDCTTKNASNRKNRVRNVDSLMSFAEEVKAKDDRNAMRPALDGNDVMQITGLSQGRELGLIMKYLNSDEGIALSRDEAIAYVTSQMP